MYCAFLFLLSLFFLHVTSSRLCANVITATSGILFTFIYLPFILGIIINMLNTK